MELTPIEVRLIRTQKQYLRLAAEAEALREVVASLGGINAQRPSAMMLSLRARIRGLEPGLLDEAIAERRELVRTWAMRGTIHLLDSEDVRWIVELLGPVFVAADKRRRAELGLNDDVLHKGLKAIGVVLRAGEPLTRWEIMDELEQRGFSLDRKSQAPIHLIRYAALQGLVCLGPYRENGEPTYLLLDQWLGGKIRQSREPSLTRLIGRYLKGYGPASINDFAAWSGIPVTRAKEAWNSSAFIEASVEARSLRIDEFTRPAMGKSIVRLLPAFDSYVLGYANRDLVVPKERQKDVYHGGQTAATAVVDGEAVGIWRYERSGKRMAIEVSLFRPLDPRIKSSFSEEAEDVGRFLGFPVSLRIK